MKRGEKGYLKNIWNNRRGGLKRQGIKGSHSYEEWLALKAKYKMQCAHCKVRESTGVTLTQDHIIPISKGGTDNITNIQPLCRSCNSRKQATSDYMMVVTESGKERRIKLRGMTNKDKIIKEWSKVKLVHPSYGSIAKKVGVSKSYVYLIVKEYASNQTKRGSGGRRTARPKQELRHSRGV